jgi:glycosyltransferase involved in cell wall biosynthesis
MDIEKPEFSILIPVYNEESILEDSIDNLLQAVTQIDNTQKFELILCENGCTDETPAISKKLAARWSVIRIEQLPVAGYGKALRHGMRAAQGKNLITFNADFWDVAFLVNSLRMLKEFDIVIGSKNAPGSSDKRPFLRKSITTGFNRLIQILFGFKGTDTHGIKAFRTAPIVRIVEECVTEGEIFDTELIIRAQRSGLNISEIPVSVGEMRPSRYSLLQRIPKTLLDLILLIRIFGFNNAD